MRLACSFARAKAGNSKAARSARIATTTTNSIRVKARQDCIGGFAPGGFMGRPTCQRAAEAPTTVEGDFRTERRQVFIVLATLIARRSTDLRRKFPQML